MKILFCRKNCADLISGANNAVIPDDRRPIWNPGQSGHALAAPSGFQITLRVSGMTAGRAPFYELVEWAEPKEGRLGVWSGGVWWELGAQG